jgi:hypothetical protein
MENINIAVNRMINHKGLGFSVSSTKEIDTPISHKMIIKPKKKKEKKNVINHEK